MSFDELVPDKPPAPPEIIDLLLASGANAARQSADGVTALSLAQAMGAKDAAARLASVHA